MGTYECLLQKTGSGTPSSTHASAINVVNSNDETESIPADIALWEKARWVKNRLTNRDNLTGWTNYLSSDSWDGTATKVTATGTGGFIYTTFVYGGGALANRSFVLSFDVWTDAGQGTTANMHFYDSGGVNVNGGNMTISTTSQRFAVTGTFPPGETHTSITIRVGAAVSGDYIYVNKAQLEETTSNLDVALPGEYQDTTTPTAYANANGNTISSQLVTLAAGTPFTDQPYLHNQPAYTNVIKYSNDLTATTTSWLLGNSCTTARNQTGIDGTANTATTVTWGVSNSYVNQYIDNVSVGDTITGIVWVKKTTSATTYPGMGLYRNTGTDTAGQSAGYIFNTDDGTYTGRTGFFDVATSSVESILVGDFWKVIIHLSYADPPATPDDLYFLYIQPSAALASAPTTWDTSNSGSCVIGNVNGVLNKTNELARRAGPIFTGASSVTTAVTSATWDSANHDNNEGGYYVEVDYQGGEVDILSNDGVAILYIEEVGGGSELVTNGDFTTNTTGWTGSNATLSKVTFDSRSNVLSVADNGGWSQAKQAITTVAGETYAISGMRHNNNIASNGFTSVYDGDTTGSASTDEGYASDYVGPTEPAASSSWESYTLEFIAQSTTTTIALGSTGTDTAYFDDISVKKKEEQLTLNDGTNTISTAITTGEHQIGIAWETDTSEMDLCLDGTWYGSSDAYDGSFGTGDLSTEATIRELQWITGDLTTSKAAIDVLMP